MHGTLVEAQLQNGHGIPARDRHRQKIGFIAIRSELEVFPEISDVRIAQQSAGQCIAVRPQNSVNTMTAQDRRVELLQDSLRVRKDLRRHQFGCKYLTVSTRVVDKHFTHRPFHDKTDREQDRGRQHHLGQEQDQDQSAADRIHSPCQRGLRILMPGSSSTSVDQA